MTPIQRGFEYEVSLCVSIPLAWATLLKQAAKHHYDRKCRDAGDHGVVNGLYNTAQDGEWPSTFPVTWSDLDLTTKVAEQLEYHTQDHALIRAIRTWLRVAMAMITTQRASLTGTAKEPNGEGKLSDQGMPRRPEDMAIESTERLAQAIRGQVAKFSDLRLSDGDDVWREREIEYRRGITETANAACVALKLDAATFAAACGLYVSDGRDSYSDCRHGELTWEKPWSEVS